MDEGHSDAHPETHTETGTAGHGEGGLPQLNPDYFAGQLFWLAIAFLFLYFVLSRVALPRIATVIEERRDRIADDLDKAKELQAQAEAAEKAYIKAVNDARAEGRALADQSRQQVKDETDRQRASAEAELDQRLAAAEKQIAAMKDAALSNVEGIAAEAAAGIVERLTGTSVPADEATRAVQAARS
ncbi:MAG: F0F1 ATP synthase subunit B' [Alphaproteobacteria bacterium]|nr:F0F1 ATP synthase subunit B' [Alphaproteobacteria bacterium]